MDMWVFVYFYPLVYIYAKRHHVQTNWSLGLRMRSRHNDVGKCRSLMKNIGTHVNCTTYL